MTDIKDHIITCTECRQYTREMLNEDRGAIEETFRNIIREEWQTSNQIKERVARLEKTISWVVIFQAIEAIMIAFVCYEIIIK